MTLYRVQHNVNYTVINNTICKDNRISWKAKGIWLYAFSRPDDWKFYITDIINQSTDGKDSVYAGLKELENAGYLRRARHRRLDGTFEKELEMIFYETPFTEQSEPKRGFPDLDNPDLDKPPLVSTDVLPSTDKEQQQGAAVSLISACLEPLEIPIHDKQWISDHYTYAVIGNAVKWATHPMTKINTTLQQAIKWACANQPQIPANPADEQQQNKAFAQQLEAQYQQKGIEGFTALNTYAEVYQRGGMSNNTIINYTEKAFKEQVLNALRKHGILK